MAPRIPCHDLEPAIRVMDPLELLLAGLDLRCFLTSTAETVSFEAILTTGREFADRLIVRTEWMLRGKVRLLPRALSERRSTWTALVVLQDAAEEKASRDPAKRIQHSRAATGQVRSAGTRPTISERRKPPAKPNSKIAPQQTSQIVAKRVGHRLMSSPNTETHRGQYLAGGRALSSLVALFHLSDPNRR